MSDSACSFRNYRSSAWEQERDIYSGNMRRVAVAGVEKLRSEVDRGGNCLDGWVSMVHLRAEGEGFG